MRKPVITGDSPTVRATLCHGEHVYLVRRADGEALARAILALYDDPALREKLARQGYDYWQERFTVERIGQQFREHLAQIV